MVNFVQQSINTYNINNSKVSTNNIRRAFIPNLNNQKQDIYFKGLSKPYNMSKAKKQEDIPEDANIFLFNCKSTVNLPEGRSAKECILTDKGFGFWARFFGSDDANKMLLKNNDVEYAHGDLTGEKKTCGVIEVDNSNVNQIENVTMVRLKNNANVNFIDNVDEIDAFDSTMGDVKIKGAIHLNGNTKSDKLKAYTVVTYPGDIVNNSESNFLACKEDINQPDTYSQVNNANASIAADITQAKIGTLKTGDLIFNNSQGNHVEANYGVEFNNSVVDYLKIGTVKRMSGCKIKKFDLINTGNDIKFYDKVQIDELNLSNDEAKLFIIPKPSWGEKSNNYIKTLNIKNDYKCPSPRPRIKIQGPINIDKVVFYNNFGVLEVTQKENHEKPIYVVNGIVKYNVPTEPIPDCDDLDI